MSRLEEWRSWLDRHGQDAEVLAVVARLRRTLAGAPSRREGAA